MAEIKTLLDAQKLCSLLVNIVDEMFEGFQVLDGEGRYLYLNKAAAKQGKRTPQDLLGKKMIEEYPGTEKTEMYRRLMNCFVTGKRDEMINEFAFPDGSRGWFQLMMEPIEGGVLVLSIDITQIKEKEKLLEEKNAEMEKTLRLLVGREMKMVEMKQQLGAMLQKNRSERD